MSAMRSFCICLVSLPALLAQSQASAETLAEAVNRLDAKYLNVPDIEAGDSAPKIEAGGGEENSGPTPERFRKAPIKATLTYTKETSEEGDTAYAPVVTVFADGKEVAKLEGGSHRLRRSAGQRADRRARSRKPASRNRRLVLYRRRALLLRHERDPITTPTVELEHARPRRVRRRPDAYGRSRQDGAMSSRPATTPSSTPSPAMPARRRRSRCWRSRTAR